MRATFLFLVLAATSFASESAWPQFRGPGGLALDAKTGDIAWTTPRTDLAAKNKSGWATPFIWVTPERTEIVTVGKGMVVSYGLDGRELWRLRGMTQATPSPTAGGGLLYVGSGSQGENNRPLLAIKPGASGDISLPSGETSGPFVA